MTGSRGPVPKRSDQRRRRNKVEGGTPDKVAGGAGVQMPAPDESWQPMARDWYVSLAASGQSVFFEASDWQQARVAAEMLHRMLEARTKGGSPAVNGQALSAWLSMTTTLMVTEGDRRRLRIELQRGEVVDADEDASVTALDAYRAQIEA
ncbi:MAG TPA: hypothetical protein VFH56_10995 [Acidimicrobiales bacterium]|nr:hypothetical protein [Acidimicrobiales bacterium]